PQVFGAYTLKDLPLSVGLGIYAPYGLGLKWPQDTGFRTLGVESSVTYIRANPVVAWRVLTNFSVAAGVSDDYAKMNLQEGLFWPTSLTTGFSSKVAAGPRVIISVPCISRWISSPSEPPFVVLPRSTSPAIPITIIV